MESRWLFQKSCHYIRWFRNIIYGLDGYIVRELQKILKKKLLFKNENLKILDNILIGFIVTLLRNSLSFLQTQF